MTSIFKKGFYKNGYLLIIAAWLYTISFIFSNYGAYSHSPEQVKKETEAYIQNSIRQFQAFAADTALLRQAVRRNNQPLIAAKYDNSEAGLFIYTKPAQDFVLHYWNNNKMLPEEKDLTMPDGQYFSAHTNGYFVFVKATVSYRSRDFIACCLIPVLWDYHMDNGQLPRRFQHSENLQSQYELADGEADFYINSSGKALFGLKEKKQNADTSPGALALTLRVLAILFVCIFLNAFSFEIAQRKGWAKGFLVLLASVVSFRALSYLMSFPFNFRSLSLFDNLIYASNALHPSLGDLFINVLLVFWLVSFVKFAGLGSFDKTAKITGEQGWALAAALSASLIIISFTSAGIIRSLIKDSKISFDVTSFFSLDVFTLVSFIILCFVVLSFFHFSHVVLLFLYKCSNVPVYMRYLFVAIFGLFYLSLMLGNPVAKSNLAVLVWLIGYMLFMEFRKEDIYLPVLHSSFFLLWIIFFTASISALIIYENAELSLQQRKKEAERIATEANPNAQYFFTAGIADISDSFLSSSFDLFKNEVSNKNIKDSLTLNLSASTTLFETKIYTFDENRQPLYNDDSIPLSVLETNANRRKKMSVPDLFFYEKEANNFSFIYDKKVRGENDEPLGYFIIVANPKKYKTEAVYPELFKPESSGAVDYNITYAVYSQGKLVKNNGEYDFASVVALSAYPRSIYEQTTKNGVSELWYNAGGGKLIITVRKTSLPLEFITLFAYLFAAFFFIVMLMRVAHLLIKYRFRLGRMREALQFTVRHQIQATFIFISIFSFLVIGFSTITFYIKRYGEANREKLVRSIKLLANEIEKEIASHNLGDDGVKLYEPGPKAMLEQTLQQVSEVNNADANFYDLNGNLQATTQPKMYARQIFSAMMNPKAFRELAFGDKILFIQKESVGDFSFQSVYVPVKDEQGKTYAYLNTPYLNTQRELNQEISNFLVTLINLNAFIFVIAGAISVLLTYRITNSFTLIGNKMKEINLGEANEEITWSTNDEIGALVNEYNKMVRKLEHSAEALAKSERESAWREMARQVAHEIKNPLTPMKLSVQYLQKAIQEKNPDMQELSRKVSATLVEQIDQLAKIASDFSQFANISHVKVEVFDVCAMLTSLINLYSANEKLQITFNHPDCSVRIKADKSQINRLFTNLFQNAIEASDGMAAIPIDIQQEIHDDELLIKFTDKGSGIPAEKHAQIFTPNFTTKTSGTGLGLAISKGIVENANGKIWFDTVEGEGTTFHVLLPLVS